MERRSRRLRRISHKRFTHALLLVLAVMVGVGIPTDVPAQTLRGTSFTTANGDHSITWNENWTASLEGDDEFATMVTLEGQIMIYAVMFIHDPLEGLGTRSVYSSLSTVLTGSFDSEPTRTVEWEGEDGSYHGAHVVLLSGIDFLLYLRVDPAETTDTGPIMQLAAAPVRAFPSSFEAMQSDISIDNGPSLGGENGNAIVARLDTAVASPDAARVDLESTRAPVSSPGGATEREPFPAAALESAATPAMTSYVSARTGFTVAYGDSWEDMAARNATVGEFSLRDVATGRAVVSFNGRSTTEIDREAFFRDIVQRESRYFGYVGSVMTNDRLLVASWTDTNELVVLEYVFVSEATLVTVMVTVSTANPESIIAEVRGIHLDGEGILRDWEKIWPFKE